MTPKEQMLRLAQVKTALADKYTHLATVVKSKPRQQKYLRQVEKHRRQAADLVTQAHAR